MPSSIKRLIRESPLAPLARSIRRLWLSPAARALDVRNSKYDDETRRVLRRTLRADSNAIDVGAHDGSILREIVRMAPQGTHHAFEPLPGLAAGLRRRFPTVEVHAEAVAETPGVREFVHVVNAPAYSGLQERSYDRPDPRLSRIQVTVSTIDTAIPETTLISFIKLDIEGGEYHALRGAVRTIERGLPVIVFEAGSAAPAYGVSAEMLYDFVTRQLGYRLSLMERWLADRPPLTRDEFTENWEHGPDYYFIAVPPARRPAGVR